MKFIERFSYGSGSVNSPAGTYGATDTETFYSKFNVILNGFVFSHRSYDSVSNQSIDSTAILIFTIPSGGSKDPALIQSSQSAPFFANRDGRGFLLPLYVELSAGDVVTVSHTINLKSVTANQIKHAFYWSIRYLCPEDYLSVDPFNV